MIDSARARILLVLLLLGGQFALFPLYETQPVNPDAWVFPRSGDFVDAPDEYLGERVAAAGFVQETDPLVIEASNARITVTGSDLSPEVGDKVRVYGVLTEPRTIDAIHAFAVPPGGLWYTWSVSFLAGLWVLGRLVRHWRFDPRRLSFSARDEPLTTGAVIDAIRSERGDPDA